MLVGFERVFSN